MAPVQLVGPVGRDDEDRLGGERGREEAQERARRGVGPVQVLDHEQHGRAARQAVEHRQQRLEDARLVAGAADTVRAPRRARAAGSRARHGCRPAAPPAPGRRRAPAGAARLRAAHRPAPPRPVRRSPRSAPVSRPRPRAPAARPPACSCRRPTRRRRTPATAARRRRRRAPPGAAPAPASAPPGGSRSLPWTSPQGSQARARQAAARRGRRCSAAWTTRNTSSTLSVTIRHSTSSGPMLPMPATCECSHSTRPSQ